MDLEKIVLYRICYCIILGLVVVFVLEQVSLITLSPSNLLIISFIVGIALIPFADKIKIGNLIELEKTKKRVEKIEKNQFLGEVVIIEGTDDEYYYDEDELHLLPDSRTVEFLKSRKGKPVVPSHVYSEMRKSYKMDSVINATILNLGDHYYFLLNDKKYYIEASKLGDLNIDKSKQNERVRKVTFSKLRLIPTGK
jgi:hypothetical protein